MFLQTLGLQRFALLKPATPEIKVAVASVFFSMEMFVIVKLILMNEYCKRASFAGAKIGNFSVLSRGKCETAWQIR